ncbi:MAG: Gfo/Idh/MocA family oxidoreductase [Paracoccaceae bacterium]
MTNIVRWGILGAAKIARTDLAPAIHAAENAELAALATSSTEKAAPFRAIHPGLSIHDTYDALLADPKIDAVYIPLPNHMHVEWTLKALAAGKHVLCEKPIALKAADIDGLIAARDAAGRLAAEGFMVVHHPQWHHVRDLLAKGAVGELTHVEGAFSFYNDDPDNIRNRPETGGGALLDIGVYPSVTTRFATGAEPRAITADIRRENGIDTFARVWAEFPGFTMSFYCGMRLQQRQEMVFHGTEGWIRLTAPFNANKYADAVVEWRRPDGASETRAFTTANHYKTMIEAFGRSVTTGATFACPLEFSRGNQAMIDAIYAAGERDLPRVTP